VISLSDVNVLPIDSFVDRFGDVAEHSPWVAEAAGALRPFASREAMVLAFAQAVRTAPRSLQLKLVNAHPDLAGRAARAGSMAADSVKEQAGAGLDTLTDEEYARFTDLNDRYRARFGFPFILAVKGATKHRILESFAERVGNAPAVEFENALGQIARIFRFRIEDRVSPD